MVQNDDHDTKPLKHVHRQYKKGHHCSNVCFIVFFWTSLSTCT